MMEHNLVQIIISLSAINIAAITFISLFMNKNNIPNFLQGIVRYGKVVDKQEYLDKHFKVSKRYFRNFYLYTAPISVWKSCCEKQKYLNKHYKLSKRCFQHFYLYTAPISTLLLIMAVYVYFYHEKLCEIIYIILDFQLGSFRRASASPEATTLAIFLLSIHTWKRFYESYYINVFSDAKMSALIYIVGMIHYTAVMSSIVGESYGFVRGSYKVFQLNNINSYYIICAIIFLIADYEQYKTNVILANLRKNKSGKVITTSYKIPSGRLFSYVSSPLQLTEIVIYVMLAAILWEATTIYTISVWVVINQIASGTLQHQWYKNNFENYPTERKIIFPFLV